MCFVVFIAYLDAQIKGHVAQDFRYDTWSTFWSDGWAWRYNTSVLAVVAVVIGLLAAWAMACHSLAWSGRFVVGCLLLGPTWETIFYWWWLKPLGIVQKRSFKGFMRPAGWFDYPDTAPWLIPHKWFMEVPTRAFVYSLAVIALGLTILLRVWI